MDWRDRITANPQIAHGAACIKGTRIPVSVILDNLAVGVTAAEVVHSYPPLAMEDVQAAMSYAADLARERVAPLPAVG